MGSMLAQFVARQIARQRNPAAAGPLRHVKMWHTGGVPPSSLALSPVGDGQSCGSVFLALKLHTGVISTHYVWPFKPVRSRKTPGYSVHRETATSMYTPGTMVECAAPALAVYAAGTPIVEYVASATACLEVHKRPSWSTSRLQCPTLFLRKWLKTSHSLCQALLLRQSMSTLRLRLQCTQHQPTLLLRQTRST